MKHPIVVIGAGLSGLMVARTLRARGEQVVILEKSRGVGGRLATKRVGQAVFDHGAQFFTVRDPGFSAVVGELRNQGAVAGWPGGPEGRMIGRPSMTGLPKALSEGLDIRREQKVTSILRHDCGCWELAIEGHGMLCADQLVVSAPLPQALALLAAGEVKLAPELEAELATIQYHPCLALLVTLDGPSRVPVEGVALKSGPVRWIADNVHKGISPGVPAAVTLHAAAEFAGEHYAMDEAAVAARLLPAAAEWLGGAKVLSTTLHRWKFSEPRATFREPCVWLPEWKLGFCGDAFGGPRVEGAAISGLALAERMRRNGG